MIRPNTHGFASWAAQTGPSRAPGGQERGQQDPGDLCDASGLRIATYPHVNMWVHRVEDAVSVVLQKLKAVGFTGPIGPGAIEFYRKLHARLGRSRYNGQSG